MVRTNSVKKELLGIFHDGPRMLNEQRSLRHIVQWLHKKTERLLHPAPSDRLDWTYGTEQSLQEAATEQLLVFEDFEEQDTFLDEEATQDEEVY